MNKNIDGFKLLMTQRWAENSATARQGEIDKVRSDLKLKLADKPGSVYVLQRTTVIHLGAQLLVRSSNLPAGSASNANTSLFGLAANGGYRVSP